MSSDDPHPPWLSRILAATDAPPPARVSRVTSTSPPQLFSDATNAIRLQFAREDAAAAGDDATPKRVVTSSWRKVKLGLAHMPKKGARDAIAGANEVWADDSSSEDESSILRDDDDDEEALEADRDDDEDENQRRHENVARNPRDAVGKPGPSSSDARDRREASLVSAIPDGADVREIVWSFQNLDRVPPGLVAAVADRARSLDLAHNALSRLPSRLARLEHLVELDVSHNRLERVPPRDGAVRETPRALAATQLDSKTRVVVGVAFGVDASARGGEPVDRSAPRDRRGGRGSRQGVPPRRARHAGVGPRRGTRVDAARERRVGFGGGEPGRGGASPGAVSSRFFYASPPSRRWTFAARGSTRSPPRCPTARRSARSSWTGTR